MKKINLKIGNLRNSDLIHKIRNQPNVRRLSINSKKNLINEHNGWFVNFIKNKKNKIFIIQLDKISLGYIRYTYIYENIYEISIALKKKYEGKNFASLAIEISEKILNKNCILISKVKKSNIRSIKFFEKNHYSLLQKSNKINTYFKIYNKNYAKDYKKVINSIEKVRKKNNVNWMKLLKLSYSLNPHETKKIFENISILDKQINKMSKKLL